MKMILSILLALLGLMASASADKIYTLSFWGVADHEKNTLLKEEKTEIIFERDEKFTHLMGKKLIPLRLVDRSADVIVLAQNKVGQLTYILNPSRGLACKCGPTWVRSGELHVVKPPDDDPTKGEADRKPSTDSSKK